MMVMETVANRLDVINLKFECSLISMVTENMIVGREHEATHPLRRV